MLGNMILIFFFNLNIEFIICFYIFWVISCIYLSKKVIENIVFVLKLLVILFFKMNIDVLLEWCNILFLWDYILMVIYDFV